MMPGTANFLKSTGIFSYPNGFSVVFSDMSQSLSNFSKKFIIFTENFNAGMNFLQRGIFMGVKGISGMAVTGTLGDANAAMDSSRLQKEANRFADMVKEMQRNTAFSLAENKKDSSVSGVSSTQIAKNHRLNGDYTQGFYGTFTAESDKTASPKGFAAGTRTSKGKTPVIDKTSDLYAQSMEMENYMVKMMLSSMRNTIQHTSLSGENNKYARKMYDDMMYDNMAEAMTKNSSFGLADQIYIELSGQRK